MKTKTKLARIVGGFALALELSGLGLSGKPAEAQSSRQFYESGRNEYCEGCYSDLSKQKKIGGWTFTPVERDVECCYTTPKCVLEEMQCQSECGEPKTFYHPKIILEEHCERKTVTEGYDVDFNYDESCIKKLSDKIGKQHKRNMNCLENFHERNMRFLKRAGREICEELKEESKEFCEDVREHHQRVKQAIKNRRRMRDCNVPYVCEPVQPTCPTCEPAYQPPVCEPAVESQPKTWKPSQTPTLAPKWKPKQEETPTLPVPEKR